RLEAPRPSGDDIEVTELVTVGDHGALDAPRDDSAGLHVGHPVQARGTVPAAGGAAEGEPPPVPVAPEQLELAGALATREARRPPFGARDEVLVEAMDVGGG